MKPKYFEAFEKVTQSAFTGAYETSELGELIDELHIYLVVYTVTNRQKCIFASSVFRKPIRYHF